MTTWYSLELAMFIRTCSVQFRQAEMHMLVFSTHSRASLEMVTFLAKRMSLARDVEMPQLAVALCALDDPLTSAARGTAEARTLLEQGRKLAANWRCPFFVVQPSVAFEADDCFVATLDALLRKLGSTQAASRSTASRASKCVLM